MSLHSLAGSCRQINSLAKASKSDCFIHSDDGRLAATAVKHRGQYHLNITRPAAKLVTVMATRATPYNDDTLELWHRRTGHLSMS